MLRAPVFREPAPAIPTVDRLGRLVRNVKASRTEATRMVLAVVFFVPLAAVVVALFVLALFESEPGLGLGGTLGSLLLVSLFGYLAYASIAYAYRYLGSSLALHENGFVFAQRTRSTPIVWDDVARWTMNVVHVRVGGVRARTARSFTLTTTDGRRILLTGAYEGAADHYAWMEAELTRRKVPAVLASLDAGMPIVFGPFVVDRGGVAGRGRRVPWDDVRDVAVEGPNVVVRTTGEPLRAPYAKVPSPPVFFAVVARLREPRALTPS